MHIRRVTSWENDRVAAYEKENWKERLGHREWATTVSVGRPKIPVGFV